MMRHRTGKALGFPPEFWYRIADEEGILIQDEFPIWNMERGKAAVLVHYSGPPTFVRSLFGSSCGR